MSDEKRQNAGDGARSIVYQRRLANYLRGYRLRQDISSKDMAAKLGYASSNYSRLESETIPFDRFISSIEFLKMLADIEGLTFSEFACYLEGAKAEGGRSQKWKAKLVDIFENIGSKTMRSFLAVANTDSKREKEELEMALDLYNCVKSGNLSSETLNSLLQITKDLCSKGKRNG
jgi:transcriptional regulator with XRE-family HTH domain